MDILWLKRWQGRQRIRSRVHHHYDKCSATWVEFPAGTQRVMVLPEERKADLDRKMQSPLFKDYFEKDEWQILYFDKFRDEFTKSKSKTKIDDLLGIQSGLKKKVHATSAQATLEFDRVGGNRSGAK